MLLLFLLVAPTTQQTQTEAGSFGWTAGHGGGFGFHGGWHHPCGLPHYTDKLPVELQAQVRAIWMNYRPGDNCDLQRAQSRQIFWSLPEDQRMQIWQTMGQGRGGWGGHWRNRPCGPPRMIDSFPMDIQQQVHAIWATYQPGTSCDTQRMQTHQVFWSLPQETRMQLWQQMRQSFASRFGGQFPSGGGWGGMGQQRF